MEENIKRYKFQCGLEASQEELTLEQDYKIMDLVKSVNIADISNTSIQDLIKILSENKLIEKFLAIIFETADEEKTKQFSKLKNSELKEVITDFFILNPLALDALKTLKSAAGMTTMSPILSDSEQNANDTQPTS